MVAVFACGGMGRLPVKMAWCAKLDRWRVVGCRSETRCPQCFAVMQTREGWVVMKWKVRPDWSTRRRASGCERSCRTSSCM